MKKDRKEIMRKRLRNGEMNRAIWDIEPTDRQLSSRQWLKENGWRQSKIYGNN